MQLVGYADRCRPLPPGITTGIILRSSLSYPGGSGWASESRDTRHGIGVLFHAFRECPPRGGEWNVYTDLIKNTSRPRRENGLMHVYDVSYPATHSARGGGGRTRMAAKGEKERKKGVGEGMIRASGMNLEIRSGL